MILLPAVLIGLLAGLTRALVRRRSFHVPQIRFLWLVILAYLPQAFVFSLPTRDRFSQETAAAVLILSQAALLVFVFLNRKQCGFWLLGAGLALNFLVISMNGGLMPISPETIARRSPALPPNAYPLEQRLAGGKDVVLRPENTRFEILSDRFVTPDWIPYHVAFSLGDVILSFGMIIFLFSIGGPPVNQPT